MDKFFDLENYYFLKQQEILVKFAEGIEHLNLSYKDRDIRSHGLKKLCRLKGEYEEQLRTMRDAGAKDDLAICFKCYAKPEGPCTDC